MFEHLDLRGVADPGLRLTARHGARDDAVPEVVTEIIGAVRTRGDDALRELTKRFDGCDVAELRVPPEALRAGLDEITTDVRGALEYAAGEIRTVHEAQRVAGTVQERAGVTVRELVLPVDRAGCYVPGGRGAYPSTVLMTGIPARVAGVDGVAMCIPPGPDGEIPAVTRAAAALAGIDEVYRVGGAQAVAALAYGTETIAPVDVIVGPGNMYVTLAKREVAGVVGIDSLAGPSELVVVADASADAEVVAADLLAQAEHGPDGAAVLVTWDPAIAAAVESAVARRLDASTRRAEIASTLETGGRIVLVDGPEAAMAVANAIAPEHLELQTVEPEALVPRVRNAGAVFCGAWTPAVIGDYVAGVNHVLPTAGTARFASALRVDDFLKHVNVVTVSEEALARVSPHVRALADAEDLPEHRRAVDLRADRRAPS